MLLCSAQGQLLVLCALVLTCSSCSVPTPLLPQFKGSVGLPHHGVQTDAVELPARGEGFVRYRPHGRAYWGQPELVDAIESVSANLDETMPGGPDLVLGDLSAKHGGKIPRHNSHRSGRDIDLLWFVTTLRGTPIRVPGFIRIGPDGLAQNPATGDFYRLDVDRQWQVLKRLLLTKEINVQWMFCSRWVEAMLIAHARALGEPDELVWRAETVLLQPADSLPHDDHIHLRISCTPTTVLSGCSGGGPYWEWLPELPSLELTEADLLEIGQQDPLDLEPGGSDTPTEQSARNTYSPGGLP